ncbi:hypothetical protein [Leptospira alstonii]|uniref:Uncharacterized protein n=2 Tax=Leptospira alstonii TaxID=28452 RepID=M6CSB9_9LEPT|nr:hypothetical protein [Leptospira alstonii]EMJ94847.1 hypothetical protein LEP1GSC194_3143 [Leptospira alstonii serovar Sichuan str. 79601]EQA81133.1 hypothetical protein LEP1GSC193_2317 [Leptospira alstonii serovar Pingchang str. 80-412]
MESIAQKKKYGPASSVETEIGKDASGIHRSSKHLSRTIREKIKTELRYRYGSVAAWVRNNDLNYGYVTQVLNGIAPGYTLRPLFEKEGLIDTEIEGQADAQ